MFASALKKRKPENQTLMENLHHSLLRESFDCCDIFSWFGINNETEQVSYDGSDEDLISKRHISPGKRFKVMIVGDSISQGREGDYTWRYRLWEWLQTEKVSATFVGPYTGTFTPEIPEEPPSARLDKDAVQRSETATVPATGGYARAIERDWDSHHCSIWGWQLAQAKLVIFDRVATFQPDYLLVELGFNDLGWLVSNPSETLRSMKTLITQARSAKPDVRFALANVPQRSLMDGRDDLSVVTDEYNALLRSAVPRWSTEKSPIRLMDFRAKYGCGPREGCESAYDGLHPNALGEYQIARAFAGVLSREYHVGERALVIPRHIPERPIWTPRNFRVESVVSGVKVTWHAVYGAFGYDVRERIKGSCKWNEFKTSTNRFDRTWCASSIELEYQVRTDNEGSGKSAWTQAKSAITAI